MRIALFGAGGKIGRVIADELLLRSHQVTGVTRGGNVAGSAELAMTVKAADVTNPDVVADLIKDHDAVASAVGPRLGVDDDEAILVGAARSLITAMRKAKLRRLIVLGGAGGLEVFPGVRVVDQPDFPPCGRKTRWHRSMHLSYTVRWTTWTGPLCLQRQQSSRASAPECTASVMTSCSSAPMVRAGYL